MNLIRNLLRAALLLATASLSAAEILPPGNRAVPLGIHALTGGKVVVEPGEVLYEFELSSPQKRHMLFQIRKLPIRPVPPI